MVEFHRKLIAARQRHDGSTPASTALVQYAIDTPLIQLTQRIGADAAQAAYRGCRHALEDLIELILMHRIDCDVNWCGSLFLAAAA